MAARRTKIVATLGPASDRPEQLDALLAAGVDCVRINCSHGSADDQRARSQAARAAAAPAGRPLGVLFDLQGPKLRLAADTAPQQVRPGDPVSFAPAATARDGDIRVDFPDFVALVTERSQLVIGDGMPRFAVEAVEAGRVRARAVVAGPLSSRKGINVTYARPNLPALT